MLLILQFSLLLSNLLERRAYENPDFIKVLYKILVHKRRDNPIFFHFLTQLLYMSFQKQLIINFEWLLMPVVFYRAPFYFQMIITNFSQRANAITMVHFKDMFTETF